MRALCWLALVLAPTAAAAAEPTSCPDRLDLMQRRLQAVPGHVTLAPASLGARLPQRTGAPEVALPGPVLEVKGGVVAFQGTRRDLTNLDDIWDLMDSVKRLEGMTKSPAAPLYLRLDGAEDVQALLPMLCRVAPERKLSVLVEDPEAPLARYAPPPPPDSLAPLFTQLGSTASTVQRAGMLSQALERAIGGCDPLRSRFEALAQVPLEERPARMRTVLLDGVAACGCAGVAVDEAEALVLRILAPAAAQSYALPFPLRCEGGKKATLRLPVGADVRALVAALATRKGGGAARIRFEAK